MARLVLVVLAVVSLAVAVASGCWGFFATPHDDTGSLLMNIGVIGGMLAFIACCIVIFWLEDKDLPDS